MAILGEPHVASGNAGNRAVFKQCLDRGEARIDLDAERFRLARQIAADFAKRDDEIAMVAHQRWQQRGRQPQRRGSAEDVETIRGHRGLDRGVLAAPFRDQAVEPDRIDHRAGKNMRADLGALLHDHEGFFRRQLFEPDRGRKASRPRSDDDDVKLHRFTWRKVRCIHEPFFKSGTPVADCSRIRCADNRRAPSKSGAATIAP